MRPPYFDTLARQHGVATFTQLLDGGLTRAQIRSMIAAQRLQPLSRSVLRDATHDFSPRLGMSAAALITDGVIDRRWALFLLGLAPEPQPPITVTIDRGHKPKISPIIGIDVRRRALGSEDRTRLDGVPVTGPPLTVIDALCTATTAATTLDRALQTKIVTMRELQDCASRHKGSHGIGRATRLLEIARGDTESAAERLFLALLVEGGITGFAQQLPFGRWRLDFAHPGAKVCVEIDGWVWHRDLNRKRRDDAKQNALARAGWVTLRFGWHDLTEAPERVRQTVIACLETRLSA